MTKNIYLISASLDEGKIYKIGLTRRDVYKRLKELKTANPYELKIEKVYEANNYGSNIEKSLHRKFRMSKIEGEWFELTDSDIDIFDELCKGYYKMFDELQKNNSYIAQKGIKFK